MSWLVLVLFFCSGATALVYEVVWSKYLAQMLGSTVQAQTVVLAVFMGGLALGNRLFGARADRARNPIRLYGFIELAIGLYAFFFSSIFLLADSLFITLGTGLRDQSWALFALKGIISVALLLGPTVLMGGTLPLMAGWLQRSSSEAGRGSARFYSVNCLGAVVGAGLAGFYLVQHWGMVGALQLTALLNVLIGAISLRVGQILPQSDEPAPAPSTPSRSPSWLRSASWMVAITGAVSMGLEVLAARSLVLIFGSSLQSFSLVLMAFILGIGLGSACVAAARGTTRKTGVLIVCLMVGAALWVGLLIAGLETWVEAYRVARSGLGRTTTGYIFNQLLTGGFALVVLGVPAALLGAVLPLLIRHSAQGSDTLGKNVGRLLTWNTLGAVVGVLATGFVIMPWLGLRGAFALLCLGLVLVALITAWRWPWRPGLGLCGGAFLILVLVAVAGGDSWRHVMSSGVFRARETEVDFSIMETRKKHVRILFYQDAPDATVSVELGDGVGAPPTVGLRINGKTDASSHGDLSTQVLLGQLGFLARPDSKDVFVLGLGSGITAAAAVLHSVDSVIIAENCEPVIRASRFFDEWNNGVLTNRVVSVREEDARTVLKLDPRLYDIHITQPSNPWMAGVGSVFSQEYYELAASRLKPGGIIVQWFHLYDMHDGIVGLVLRTFGSVFPHMEAWDAGSGDLILLGSKEPWTSNLESCGVLFNRPEVRADLERIDLSSPAALLARQLASQDTAHAIAGPGPVQRDAFPILEYEAPRAFYIGKSSRLLEQFDERTWMAELALGDKQRALRALDDQELSRTFGNYSTLNEELRAQLTWRLRGGKADYPGPAPSLFLTPTEDAITDAPPAEVGELLTAARQLRGTDAESRQGAGTIEELLRGYGADADWSVVHYGGLAIKASLARGDLPQATRLLELARTLHPSDQKLSYLGRVLERRASAEAAQIVRARSR